MSYADSLKPDSRTDKELAKEILSHPLYPADGDEDEELFHQALGENHNQAAYQALLVGLNAIINKTDKTKPLGRETKSALSGALLVTQSMKEGYEAFITANQRAAETEEAQQDIPRAQQAIENIKRIDGLLAKLARKTDVELTQTTQAK